MLDSCFQALGAAMVGLNGPALPVGIDRLELWAPTTAIALSWTKTTGDLVAEVTLASDDGAVLMKAEGFRIQSLEQKSAGRDEIAEWMYTVDWKVSDRAAAATVENGAWLLLSDCPGFGRVACRADGDPR